MNNAPDTASAAGDEDAGSDDVCGGWYWGHADSKDQPPGSVPMTVSLATMPMRLSKDPDFYQDFAKYVMCPHFLDKQAQGAAAGMGCPFLGGKAFLRHADVNKRLAEVPAQHAAGQIERRNELGYLLLDGATFPMTGSLGLGNSAESHRTSRRWLEELLAPSRLPNRSGWLEEAGLFLAEMATERRFKVRSAISKWWYKMLFKHVLGETLSSEDADAFGKFQNAWLQGAVMSGPNRFADKFCGCGSVIWPASMILQVQEEYRERIKKRLPADVPAGDRDMVAQGVLEMIAFAGGLSAPSTIHCALAVLFRRDLLPSPVVINEDNIEAFVFEVTRLFPAVQGFCYWQGGQRQVLSLNAALRDPAVWGKDANKFTLKDVELYRRNHIGFANPATSAPGTFDSKACPGIQLALDVSQAFVLAVCRWQPTNISTKPHVYWSPVTIPKPQGVHKKWFSDFELEIQDWLDGDQTGEHLLRSLEPIDLARLLQEIGMADAENSSLSSLLGPSKDRKSSSKLSECDMSTKVFYELSRKRFKELSERAGSINPDESNPGPAPRYFDLDFGGRTSTIRLPVDGSLKKAVRDSVANVIGDMLKNKLDDSRHESQLVRTHSERCAAIMLCQQAFLRTGGGAPPPRSSARADSYLPKPNCTFADITTDQSQVAIARCGMGQLYLRSNDQPQLQAFGDVICDASALADFNVRPAFERMGATAVFRREASGAWTITAVDWKHGGKIVKPGDKDWEHAKWCWRCSLVTYMTAVNHLVISHWVVANAIASSCRETMSPFHPIRRLLQAITYNTASINHNSALSLFPAGGMLNRMSPFPYEELQRIFAVAADSYKFQTWPQEYEAVKLPEDVKSKLPIYQDGLEVYAAFHDFVSGYVNTYFPDDAKVTSDKELQEYWKFTCVPQYARALPQLSKQALIDQLTRGTFDVTGYHELVGYVVAYTTDPAGGSMQVRPGLDMADLQELLAVNSLVAGTGTPMPMFVPSCEPGDEDWLPQLDLTAKGGYDTKHFAEVSKLYANMMSEMKQISASVKTRNAAGAGREMACATMDPLAFERSLCL
eukprot:CAMPEP_0203843458 /NCGR_PEP_ID=MMETSP0359-20131031/2600_1 /ASSEMBLY_ACC=CAM_ASM_000338 /TAXON_ID=268821 /ORGANISM="Scrippsiella Hangoei, Strain SHTV-5" /LENGTH=1059 /DNA_ID=CAMNT_0050758227 /DNA_START=66 /DNA_END=3245 /DNA_ORIENTATION=+